MFSGKLNRVQFKIGADSCRKVNCMRICSLIRSLIRSSSRTLNLCKHFKSGCFLIALLAEVKIREKIELCIGAIFSMTDLSPLHGSSCP
jgi:hypothetical protein